MNVKYSFTPFEFEIEMLKMMSYFIFSESKRKVPTHYKGNKTYFSSEFHFCVKRGSVSILRKLLN